MQRNKLKEPILLIAERFGKFYWRVLPGSSIPATKEPFGVCETWIDAKREGDDYMAEVHYSASASPAMPCEKRANYVSVGQ